MDTNNDSSHTLYLYAQGYNNNNSDALHMITKLYKVHACIYIYTHTNKVIPTGDTTSIIYPLKLKVETLLETQTGNEQKKEKEKEE